MRDWKQRFAILDAVLLRRLRPVSARPEVLRAWHQLTQARGALSIRQLAQATGWSRRHLSEQFTHTFGLSPKTAARILRFEHACRVMMDVRSSLANVAAHCGFQDQAHMTHEWTALAGTTPSVWIASQLPFLQDYEVSTGDDER